MNSKNRKSNTQIFYASITAFFAWFAIIFQFYLTKGSIANFFSYFTILSNLLIALSLTFSIFLPKTKIGEFFSSLSVQTAIALYIFIVALVYNTVLRGILIVTGWRLIADNILHVLNPVLYILYWLRYSEKEKLSWKDGVYWAIFPFFYLIYSLIRGVITNWYPYPFLNVVQIGYKTVLMNVGVMIIVFFIIGLLLIILNNKLKKNNDSQDI
ncbi:Pr6Pr family membrane protein [Flavobacterium soyae]|uniref:Pr6Pr family membrane protein n=1 Tax=Flavobacterium soyae TaxID=2903098 RepID=A0ABZ2U9V6_9FLAO